MHSNVRSADEQNSTQHNYYACYSLQQTSATGHKFLSSGMQITCSSKLLSRHREELHWCSSAGRFVSSKHQQSNGQAYNLPRDRRYQNDGRRTSNRLQLWSSVVVGLTRRRINRQLIFRSAETLLPHRINDQHHAQRGQHNARCEQNLVLQCSTPFEPTVMPLVSAQPLFTSSTYLDGLPT